MPRLVDKPLSTLVEKTRIEYAKRLCPTPIREPQELIKEAIAKHGDKVTVSCSFGRCSVVVLHMALQLNPNIKVVFNDTGVEYPETYAYKQRLKAEWNLNLIETKPVKPFWQCVKEYGFPLIRSRYGYKMRVMKLNKPECCIYLKELPLANACLRHSIHATITGLRCSESGVRMFTIAQRGQYYHTTKFCKKVGLWRYHPIAFWTQQQVIDYMNVHQIPVNPIYEKGLNRSGCMPCTGFLHWEAQLAKMNPRMYRYIQKLRKVDLLDNYFEKEDEILNVCNPSELVKTSDNLL
jgi:phosphoadenosine phosphosulfate reductase